MSRQKSTNTNNLEEFSKEAFIERLRRLRMGYSGRRGKRDFAKAIGLGASTYNYYEKDRIPPADVLVRIARVTGVELEWLLTGRSEQKSVSDKDTETSVLKDVKNLISSDPEAAELMAVFLSLIKRKEIFERYLSKSVSAASQPAATDSVRQRGRESAEQAAGDGDAECGWIPVLGRTAAGLIHCWKDHLPEPLQAVTELNDIVSRHLGRSILSHDPAQMHIDGKSKSVMAGLRRAPANLIQIAGGQSEGVVEFLDCSPVKEMCPDCFALRIDGDSMAPRIQDGDFVLLSPSSPAGQADVAVLQVRGQIGLTCKLIRYDGRKVHIVPFNEKYPTKIIDSRQLLWALAVLGHIRLKQA